MIELIEIEPGRFRVKRENAPAARSALPCPYLISDEMPPTEQVDGRFYTSKAKFRAVGRALGLTEVGNERPRPKTRSTAAPEVRRKRREAVQRAIAQVRSR